MRSPIRNPRAFAHEPEDEAPSRGSTALGLSTEEGWVIEHARMQLGQAIKQFAPPKSNRLRLTVIAVSGMFADLTRGMAALPGILDIINLQLADVGLEVVRKRRN